MSVFDLEETLIEIYQRLAPSVVSIQVAQKIEPTLPTQLMTFLFSMSGATAISR